MNAVDIVDGAIKVVSNAWHQGDLIDNTGTKFCLVGGLHKAAGAQVGYTKFDYGEGLGHYMGDPPKENRDALREARASVVDAVSDFTNSHTSIAMFNDDKDTSLEDVLLVLKQARAKLEDK